MRYIVPVIALLILMMVRRIAPPPSKEDKDRLGVMYFETGLHYYIAARYAIVAAQFGPLSGNLVHHAIEFFLKGAVIDKLDEAGRRKFQHNLPRLWKLYKTERANPTLSKFDQTISDIHKF